MRRMVVASWVISPRVVQWCQGTCRLALCDGMRESRWCGRLGVFVDERQRTCGVEERFERVMCFGLPIRTPRVHVPAFPDSYLPDVNRITERRTLYL